MKTLQFKTSLKCSGCVEKIKTDLDQDKNISEWNVDMNTNPKVLTVKGDNITAKEIETLLEKSGYKAESI